MREREREVERERDGEREAERKREKGPSLGHPKSRGFGPYLFSRATFSFKHIAVHSSHRLGVVGACL